MLSQNFPWVAKSKGLRVLLGIFLFLIMFQACDCREFNAPVIPGTEGVVVTDASPDTISDKDVQCVPFGQPCGTDAQCNPKASCLKMICLGGICQDQIPDTPPTETQCKKVGENCGVGTCCLGLTCQSTGFCSNTPDQLPPTDGEQCPASCSTNNDCNVSECKDRTLCLNGVCTWAFKVCPASCSNNVDCQTPSCGANIQCVSGKCSALQECPNSCNTNSDCNLTACGNRNACMAGSCRETAQLKQPVAVVPVARKVLEGSRVSLDGGKSYDPQGLSLTFSWVLLSRPATSQATLFNATSSVVAFIGDKVGDYVIELTVENGSLKSIPMKTTVTVIPSQLPTPSLGSLSPSSAFESDNLSSVLLFGTSLSSDMKVFWDGQSISFTFSNNNEVKLFPPSGFTQKVGTFKVYAQNATGQQSNTLEFEVKKKDFPAPVLSKITPTSVIANTPFTLVLEGSNFVAPVLVRVGQDKYTLSNISSTNISIQINSMNIGSYNVWVTNPDGKTSGTVVLAVTAPPVTTPELLTVSPQKCYVGVECDLILTGKRFVSGMRLLFSATPFVDYATFFKSSTELKSTLKSSDLTQTGTFKISLSGSNGTSNELALTVEEAPKTPVLKSLAPSEVEANKSFTVRILGENFEKNSQVYLQNKLFPSTFVSDTELAVTVASGLGVGTYSVGVTNPTHQLKSNLLYLTVKQSIPAPVLNSVSPSRIAQGVQETITLSGSNFQNGAQVQIGTQLFKTTFIDSSKIEVEVTATLSVGNYDVYVINPDNQKSGKQALEVYKNPAPTLTKITPTEGVSGTIVSISLYGTEFLQGASGIFQGGSQNTTFVSSTELRMTLSLSAVQAGDYQIWVQNPDGQVTSKLTFKVTVPKGPQITRVLPVSGTINTQVGGIIDGSGFVNGAKITLGSASFSATFINDSTLGVTFDLSTLQAGTYPVTVINPDGQKSNSVYFQVSGTKLPAPVITTVTPSNLSLKSTTTIYITGSNFQNGALFVIPIPFGGNVGLPTNFINSNTLVITSQLPQIPFPFPTQTVQAYVQNPDKQQSNKKTMQISP